ncbi:MAG TPA: S-adenosylmethionine:tRNA ribosyltransferase-isomerase [Puia sp.]|jgi:S-adenosylmethionine:tRNA ribosyltransferase-isomerase|nr:S-adenosylmethionine:tRNA ribosyltransferase-isomerase [Puia sp.]
MNVKDISIAGFSYELPAERIAYYPLAERDGSKLLIYSAGAINEDIYRNIAGYLPQGSLMVFNNTKVVEARILFQKPTGGQIEIFCLEPSSDAGGMAAALARTGTVQWKCLIGGASKWKRGVVLQKKVGDGVLEARYLEKSGDAFLIGFSWTPAESSFAEVLHRMGNIPLPPYIHRQAEASDSQRYQTVYAQYDGSVAAPTAGLHFTETIFRSLDARGIRRDFVTLHVGAGTFLPVKTATLGEHPMHVEFIEVSREFILRLRDTLGSGKPVIAVGTTSARTLESLYWLGAGGDGLVVRQWDPYQPESRGIDAVEALSGLLLRMEEKGLSRLVTTTQLLIMPGYRWRIVNGLVTNFHQPESTLLLLVASLIGDDWRRVYAYAMEHDFRFLSYGDGCLLLPAGTQE